MSAATRSSPECAASASMPRLPVKRPTMIFIAVSPMAATRELRAAERFSRSSVVNFRGTTPNLARGIGSESSAGQSQRNVRDGSIPVTRLAGRYVCVTPVCVTLERHMSFSARGFSAQFWALVGATFLGFLGIGTVLPLLAPHIRYDLGGSAQDVGLVIGIFSFVALLGRMIAVTLADRRGRKISFLDGLVCCACARAIILLPL